MNLDSLNKWLMLAANLGVIAGIIFLAIEINQNSLSTQAQTRTQLTVIANQMIEFISKPEYVEARTKQLTGEELSEYEESLLGAQVLLQLRTGENVFYQHRIGTFNDEEFQGYENFYREYFQRPFNRETWEDRKNIFSPDFQKEIEVLLSE